LPEKSPLSRELQRGGIAESDFGQRVESQTPLGRVGRPHDITPAAVFIALCDSAWITGEDFYISGGQR